MIAQNVFFGVLALAMAVGAVRVVTTKNVVHAALYLVVVLGGAAGLFVLLAAEFTAVTQVLVYIGAIIVLFLFGVMLTRAPIGRTANLDNDQRFLSFVVALFLFGVLGTLLVRFFGDDQLPADPDLGALSSAAIGDSIFSTFVSPFELVSILFLSPLVGAVVIASGD